MASVRKLVRNGRHGYWIRFQHQGKRVSYYFQCPNTKSQERIATGIAERFEELANYAKHSMQPSFELRSWVASTKGRLRKKLIEWGFAETPNSRASTESGMYLGAFVQAYIDERKKDCATNTVNNFIQVKNMLVEHFGERHRLTMINPNDAQRWQRWMLGDKKLSVATVSKHSKRAKQIFATALTDGLLESNPFSILKGADESNPKRYRFVTEEDSQRILAHCPTVEWRAIVVLARYSGLRCPSEICSLTWAHINFSEGRITIDSPKTGLRYCPLFPQIKVVLEELKNIAGVNNNLIFPGVKGESNLRTTFLKTLKQAGITQYPKPFQNLRSTRRTELQKLFPSHVVDSWMGQSTQVAHKHYLQVTSDDWAKAIGGQNANLTLAPPTGPNLQADQFVVIRDWSIVPI